MRLRQHTVGYSQSQQVFKVFSSGLHKGTESFSPLVDRFVDNRLFKVSTQCPHICCRCHGNCRWRWFSTALNLLIENADGLIKCNCFCQNILPTFVLFLMKPCQKVVGVRFLTHGVASIRFATFLPARCDAIAPYMLWSYVGLSVCHKSGVLSKRQYGSTWFWHRGHLGLFYTVL